MLLSTEYAWESQYDALWDWPTFSRLPIVQSEVKHASNPASNHDMRVKKAYLNCSILDS